MTQQTKPTLTPHQIGELNMVAGDVDKLAKRIADNDRFVATMNRSDWRPAPDRALDIVAAYERATEPERRQARETKDRIRRELGITEPTVWVV